MDQKKSNPLESGGRQGRSKRAEISDRLRELEDAYPPEPVAAYLAFQRRWVRRVNAMPALTHVERCVAVFIGMMCNPDRPFCFAGTDYIGKQIGCERTAIFRAAKKLEAANLLSVDRRARAGNVYCIRWDEGD